jgi:hypothetical protein
LPEPGPGLPPLEFDELVDDLGISTVVFLHGTFEDTLRAVARVRLGTTASERFLNTIPLVGDDSSEKFRLGALKKHAEKTVDLLICESIDA